MSRSLSSLSLPPGLAHLISPGRSEKTISALPPKWQGDRPHSPVLVQQPTSWPLLESASTAGLDIAPKLMPEIVHRQGFWNSRPHDLAERLAHLFVNIKTVTVYKVPF